MAQIYEELRDGKVSLLQRLEGSELYMINRVTKAEDERHLVYLGGFLGYSFLTKTCFGVDFANCFWKQVLGHKLLAEDIGELDQQAFDRLRSEHDCDPSKPCLNL